MIKAYDIVLGNEIVGKANVSEEGLYYHFACDCHLSGGVMYQIKLLSEGKEYNLGICVPIGDHFGVKTKVPIKNIGPNNFTFYIEPRHTEIKGKFVPIIADEPFAYIDKLETAFLDKQNGKQGIWIKEDYI